MEGQKATINFEYEVPVIQCKECFDTFSIIQHVKVTQRDGSSEQFYTFLGKTYYCPSCGEEQS